VHDDPRDFFRYTADGLQELLQGFTRVEIRPIGNHYGAAWSLLASRSRWFRLLNPVMRRLGTRPDPRCPQSYMFVANP
jgi:hypothetical protein